MKFLRPRLALLSLLLLLVSLASPATTRADEPAAAIDPSKAKASEDGVVLWYDARLFPVEGQGWSDLKSPYDRLPERAEAKVRDKVWNLSRHSSGIAVPFVTDAQSIQLRWKLSSDNLAMSFMPASSVSGLDLYVRDESGKWRWLSCAPPDGVDTTKEIIGGMPAGKREYLLYLPLYNGVESLEIGIPAGNHIFLPPARPENHRKPIVFYGTSITHGASASRSGMTHPAILGRRFDRPIINLGFSGNGQMETNVTEFLAELDPAVFVIDCLPNLGAEQVTERTKPCVDILRKAHPTTPILLVEDRTYGNAFLQPSRDARNKTNRVALRKVFEELKAAGDENLYYLEGAHLLGDDNEGTVDSSHPTDLGFMRQASAFAEVLEPILNK